MRVIWTLKKIKRTLKTIIQYLHRRFLSMHYLYSKPKTISELRLEAHLLVVKKEIYASIAKVCVESFLYFHPHAKVVLHADSQTASGLSRKLKRTIARGQVSIRLLRDERKAWQESKLELILSLSQSKEFFMDADLKWNGLLPPLKGVTLFVKEFEFIQNSFYTPLTSKDWFEGYSASSMKNTSFFYWNGYEPSERDVEEIQLIMKRISDLTSESANDLEFNQSVNRISEQIALSLLVEKIDQQIYFLKKADGFKDGFFVESSYFGATGATF